MTALQIIIKEAKAIRSKNPKIEWKKAVAQASAIYASKHKGKSPVGKKKLVKKAAKKKVVKKIGDYYNKHKVYKEKSNVKTAHKTPVKANYLVSRSGGKFESFKTLSGYASQKEIIVGKINNIKTLESLVPQVKVRVTRGKKVYTNRINSITDAVDILRKFIGKSQIETQEYFAVMYLNNNNNVLGVYVIGMGGYTAVVAEKRLIMSAGLRLGATGIILCHNHPSSNLVPSEADKKFTKDIIKAAEFHDIKVVDHIILTKDSYYSFASHGII
jgi:DNA repair protein RadC